MRVDRAASDSFDAGIEEGVMIHWLRTIKSIDATTFTVEVMQIDEKGRPRPTGQLETLDADDLILALGQDTDTAFLRKVAGVEFKDDGTVIVTPQMMTGYPGLFAGGDMVPSERTVTIGVGHGKKAARNIDAFLRGESYLKPPKKDLASFDKLHLWYYTGVEAAASDPRRRAGAAAATAGPSECRRCWSSRAGCAALPWRGRRRCATCAASPARG